MKNSEIVQVIKDSFPCETIEIQQNETFPIDVLMTTASLMIYEIMTIVKIASDCKVNLHIFPVDESRIQVNFYSSDPES